MKHLLLAVLFLVLFSCGNNKAAIVEQIKSAKDSAQLYKNWASFYNLLGTEMAMYGQVKDSDKRFLDEVPRHVIEDKKWDSAMYANDVLAIRWKNKIDSLELELKKY